MEAQRALAIVLRSVPFEDRHRIVTALTENHGLVSAMARNSIQSRRFGGALDLFSASEWTFTERPGSELWSLQGAEIRRSYEGLRRDFERLSLASVFSEILLRVAPQREPCPDLFRLHSNALAALEEEAGAGVDLALLNAYLGKLLQWSGSQPRLDACLECGTTASTLDPASELSCLIDEAAWICPTCRASGTRHVTGRGGAGFKSLQLRVSARAVRGFAASLEAPIRKAAELATEPLPEKRELYGFIEALFAFHLPGFDCRPLSGLRFLGLESKLQLPAESPR